MSTTRVIDRIAVKLMGDVGNYVNNMVKSGQVALATASKIDMSHDKIAASAKAGSTRASNAVRRSAADVMAANNVWLDSQNRLRNSMAVSYTHLTLPTIYSV